MAVVNSSAKNRFLSLKWRALLLTSSLLISVFTLFYLSSRSFSEQALLSSSQERAQRYSDQFERFLQRHSERMLGVAKLLTELEGMTSAIVAGDSVRLEQVLTQHWPQLNQGFSLKSLALFSPNHDLLSWYNDPQIPAQLMEVFSTQWQVTSQMSCHQVCEFYLAYPLTIDGWGEGMLVLGSDLGMVLDQFHKMNKASIALGVQREVPSGPDALYLSSWNSELIALEGEGFDWGQLRTLANQVSFQTLEEGYRLFRGKQVFEILRRPLFGAEFPRKGEVYWVSDITQEYLQHSAAIKNGLLFSLFGLVIAELVLFLSLSAPMNRLRAIANVLPLLATQKFSYVRNRLLSLNKPLQLSDESEILNDAAVELSYLLERMQEDLSNHALQLELKTHELSDEKNFVQSILDTANAVILTQDCNGRITMCNHYCLRVTGLDAQELMGKSFLQLLSASDALPDLKYQLNELINGMRIELHHEAVLVGKDNTSTFLAWHHSVLPSDKNDYKILSIAIDISERKVAEERLSWLASHDPLTGLYNRRRFSEELQEAIMHAQRYERSGAVVFFDLDQFKDVNDTSGHQVGDHLLRCVAERLNIEARSSDLIFRLGGDEFALLIKEVELDTINAVAERLCRAINTVEVLGNSGIHRVSTSIGIAFFPQHGEFPDEVIANADIAMYQAKSDGRNGWHVYSPEEMDRERTHERVYWNERVKEALVSGSFELAFQPIQNVLTKEISHFEALLRVYDEAGNLLPTYKFIQSAEQSGLIQELDLKIIEKVLAYKQRLERRGIDSIIAINLSGASFRNPNLSKFIAEELKLYDVEPTQIMFEITETSAVEDALATADKMHVIKALGCKFALDDFGVGFSSLYHIKKLPLDLVKIDGSFVRNLPEKQEDQVLVRAVVEVAKVFGLNTVAEFVESESILTMLQQLGVDYAQGYHISEPKSFELLWPDHEITSQ